MGDPQASWLSATWLVLGLLASACGDDSSSPAADAGPSSHTDAGPVAKVVFADDVRPVTEADQAQANVFIPPYRDCREVDGEEVCTNVAISGCTAPGLHFAEQASCAVVQTQRPFWPVSPANESSEDDPRLDDEAFMTELGWVAEQVQACGCVCCHSSKVLGGQAGEWDIDQKPIWLDGVPDTGLALFSGLANSRVLGAYPADDNHGFDRDATGLPTTDTARLQAFINAELARRGVSEDESRAVPPFGGPIYANQIEVPEPCGGGEGVDPDGNIHWNGGSARYVYVLEEGSANPGVPPNFDLPDGTLWRLDVLASADPIASGAQYGETPAGSFQAIPAAEPAPALRNGRAYHLYVLRDVGFSLANCIFTYGDEVEPLKPHELRDGGGTCDNDGFGVMCTADADCGDCPADYCAIPPGQTEGYCSATDCKQDASVCPAEWSCFDLSVFSPDLPSFCAKPQ